MSNFLLGYDFYYCWVAGTLVKKGENPYARELSQRELNAIGWPISEQAMAMPHPPNTLWLYRLAAMLPFNVALLVLTIINAVAPVVCSIEIARAFCTSLFQRKFLLIFATVTFPPVVSNLIWGQVNIVLLLSLSGFALLFHRQRYLFAGVVLSVALMKPHLFFPFMTTVFIHELRKRRFTLLLGVFLGGTLQVLAALLIYPQCFEMYLTHLPAMIDTHAPLRGATISQMLQREFGLPFAQLFIFGYGILAALFIVSRFGYSAQTMLFLILPLSIISAPYAWSHSMMVLLSAYLFVINEAVQKFSEKRILYTISVFAALIIPVTVVSSVQYSWVLLPICIFIANYRSMQRVTH